MREGNDFENPSVEIISKKINLFDYIVKNYLKVKDIERQVFKKKKNPKNHLFEPQLNKSLTEDRCDSPNVTVGPEKGREKKSERERKGEKRL